MQEDWESFYLKEGTMPSSFDTFEIQVDTLQVSDYVKKKLHCKSEPFSCKSIDPWDVIETANT